MKKEQKSMDDVLASIRRIIRTDPTAAPPDAATLPRGGIADETAREVLARLQRESEGGRERTGKPLSTSDNPDEAARAVLDHLRQQAEAETEAKQERARPPAAARREHEAPPDLELPLRTPPEVAEDTKDVPIVPEEPSAEAAPDRRRRAAARTDRSEEPVELGEDAGRRVMDPKRRPPPDAELPQPAHGPAREPEHRRGEPAVMIDEAALEAMIRRIVRDELMGEMGRRVTQNVVKLIKDEIARSRLEEK